jgi:hypothetical protein
VRAGRAVGIAATVAETNGDVGEWNDCRLFVDGVQQDWAQGIWVDAGDAVTCLFQVTFAGVGTHHVEVRLGGGSPRDDDPADNHASAEVESYTSDALTYSASVYDYQESSHDFTRTLWSFTVDSAGNHVGREYADDRLTNSSGRSISFTGWTFRGLSRLPRVDVEEESGGTAMFSASYQVDPPWWYANASCGQGWDGASGVLVDVCTGPGASDETWVSYYRSSTAVTYHSDGYSRAFDDRTGTDLVYHYNFDVESESGLPLTPLGGDYTIRVRLSDGSTQLSGTATMALYTSQGQVSYPLTCSGWTDYWDGSWNEDCSAYDYSGRQTYGSADGE